MMNSVGTFKKRLREEIASVEQEIQAHNQQAEALSTRLEGLKRADELFDSDQAAIAELLQASIGDGSGITRELATAPSVTTQRAARLKATDARKQLGRGTQTGRGNMKPGRANPVARTMSHNGGLHPGRHDSGGSQALCAPDRPRINRATQQGISLESQRERGYRQAVHAPRQVRAHSA
jgi:hypothetical protein